MRSGVHQGVTPREPAAQNYHNQPSGIISAVWLYLPLLESGEWFAQEEILLASARRDLETSTRRGTRSHATEDNVLRLCVSG
jgi:hypothetical protein